MPDSSDPLGKQLKPRPQRARERSRLGEALVGVSDLQRSSCCAGAARPRSALGTVTQWSGLRARRPGGETMRWGGKERGTYRFIGRAE
ncbi:hypothetical protein NDU88_003075 [Pleurodeles waltl]|uniref:Uncharacterized protein n=1 Tax=Pleurodeles waltl TaxID=8319 RepID=A0AAV7RFK1_PLEWA|nr:hypothetical protein NDU88_003075 [Pleurodeles waltl]